MQVCIVSSVCWSCIGCHSVSRNFKMACKLLLFDVFLLSRNLFINTNGDFYFCLTTCCHILLAKKPTNKERKLKQERCMRMPVSRQTCRLRSVYREKQRNQDPVVFLPFDAFGTQEMGTVNLRKGGPIHTVPEE